MIRFVVFFKLVDRSNENIALIKQHIMRLEGKMSVLQHMEVGHNLLSSQRSFDIAALFDFETMEALHLFEHDPMHVNVVELIKPAVADIKTVVYERDRLEN